MHVRKIASTAIIAIIMLTIVAVFATSGSLANVAYAEPQNVTATSVILGSEDYDTYAVAGGAGLGAGFEVDELVTETQHTTGVHSVANLEYSNSATIALTENILAAIKSERMSAKIGADGALSLRLVDGELRNARINITVSGAIVGGFSASYGAGSLNEGVVVENFDNRALTDKERLIMTATAAEGDSDKSEITITTVITMRAENVSYQEDSVTSTVAVEGGLEYYLELDFEGVTYSIDIDGEGSVKLANGDVVYADSDQKTRVAGFGEHISYEAAPEEGSFFVNWTGDRTSTALKEDIGDAVMIQSGRTFSYVAHYSLISIDNGSQAKFEYNGLVSGPAVTITTIVNVYYAEHRYYDTATGGEGYESELRPIGAGDYTYDCKVYRDKTKRDLLGHVERQFSIVPVDITVTMETEQTLSFGMTADFINLEYQASGVPGETPIVTTQLLTIDGELVTDAMRSKIIAVGAVGYILRFTPDGEYAANYKVTDQILTITVEDNLVVRGKTLDESVGRNISVQEKTVVTSFDSEGIADNSTELTDYALGDELIKVKLGVTMGTETNRHFFLGWRIGLYNDDNSSVIYKYYTAGSSGYNFVYYIPSSHDVEANDVYKYTHVIFEAVFVEDTTAGDGDTITLSYTGSSRETMLYFSLQTGEYSFGPGSVNYRPNGTDLPTSIAPYTIGTHKMYYDIRNNVFNGGTVVGTRQINYVITIARVSAIADDITSTVYGGYNSATGWAQKMYYTLTVPNLRPASGSDGIKAYYYSLDGGATYVKLDNALGADYSLAFETPAVEAGQTAQILSYRFLATGDNGELRNIGGTDLKVLAESEYEVTAKLDCYLPEITELTYAEHYSSAWEKEMVYFTAKVSYGASGAIIRYTANNSDYTEVTGVTGGKLGFLSGSDLSVTTDETVTFAVSARELNADLTFQIRSAVGLRSSYTTSYLVRIDGIAPTIENRALSSLPNVHGWYNKATTVTLLVGDEGGSQTERVIEENAGLTVVDEGDGVYSVVLRDNAQYVIAAYDHAGQVTRMILQYNIDITEITYEIAEDSYVADTWTNADATVKFRVTAGGSGIRMSYSRNGENYKFCSNNSFTYPADSEEGLTGYIHEVSYVIPAEAGEVTYSFKLENAAGKTIYINFGKAKFDLVQPVIRLITDLGPYQHDWYQEPVIAEFTIEADGGSDLKEVTVDNGGVVVYDDARGIYLLTIDKCTVYVVTVIDNAGNFVTKELQANIDTVVPSLTIKAYIGGGDPDDLGAEADGAITYTEYDFASWITDIYDEPWIRFEFTIPLTYSGSRLQFSNDNGYTWSNLTDKYMPEDGNVNASVSTRTYIIQEQDKPYIFRLLTGSGGESRYYPLGEGNVAYVRIDFTAPVVEREEFATDTVSAFPLKSKWTSENTRWAIRLSDAAGGTQGSKVNPDTVRLRRYDADAADNDIISGAIVGYECELGILGNSYTYIFTDYYKYYLTFADYAGNEFEGDIFCSHIDKTEITAVALSVSTLTDGVAGEYINGAWLNDNQFVRFTALATALDIESNNRFGPSGAYLEGSTDGGVSWRNLNASVNDMSFVFDAAIDQYNVYKLRVVTGAGKYAVADGEYTVYRDNSTPDVSIAVSYVGGMAYGGEWTSESLRAIVTVVSGAAGGALYVGDSADGEAVLNVSHNNGGSYNYTYLISENICGNITFYFSSNKDGVYAIGEFMVRYDTSEPTIEITVDNGVASGEWCNGEVIATPLIFAGIAGNDEIDDVMLAVLEGDSWGNFESISAPYSTKISVLSGNVRRVTLRYRLTTKTGKSAISETYSINIDNFSPTGSVSLNGNKVGSGDYADWYLTAVDVMYDAVVGTSGAIVEMSYCEKADYDASPSEPAWSDWELASDTLTFTLTDITVNAGKGGTDRYYRFRLRSGSGLVCESAIYYVPIDLNYYTVDIITTVAGERDTLKTVNYAIVSGSGARIRRGGSHDISVTPVSGYYIKRLYSGEDVTVSYAIGEIAAHRSEMAETKSVNYVVGGADIIVNVEYYKEVEVDYSNLVQTLQNISSGKPIAVTITPKEEDFRENFGTMTYAIKYNGGSALPVKLGKYGVSATTAGSYAEDFFISNNAAELIIKYFSGAGDAVSPYLVSNSTDLSYIDLYMREDGTESSDYLGANRKKARFRQTGDIELSLNFNSLGAGGSGYTNAFAGFYDGQGYVISFAKTFPVSKSFAVFANITDGATILNLGVTFACNASANNTAAGSSIALIVANAYASGISGCFAKGEISVTADNVKVGGIVGYAHNSRITNCFADVKLTISSSTGKAGGIAGELAGTSYIANSYVVGGISVNNSRRYSPTLEVGEGCIYVGAVTGYCSASSFPAADNETYYLGNNLSFDGSIEPSFALGNDNYSDRDRLQYSVRIIDFFSECSTAIVSADVSGISKTVAELTSLRIDGVKESYRISGYGTKASPFLIDTADKLAVIEVLPWASYRQTADIILTENRVYSSTIPFVGIYDGNYHEIISAHIRAAGIHNGGLFGVVGGTIKNLTIKNASFIYTSYTESYFGIVAGMLTDGAELNRVTVSGTLDVHNEGNEILYVGAIAGVAKGAKLIDCVSIANVNVEGHRIVVGGMVGKAQGATEVNGMVAMTSLVVDYDGLADVGAVIGAISDEVSVIKLSYLKEVSYAVGKPIRIGIGYSAVDIDVPALDYELITADKTLISYETSVGEIVKDLNPFDGDGTADKPFHIKNYNELMLVSNYMYASFVLDNDIVVGDHNGDGVLDATDEYSFDYAPLGGGATFTGSFNGKYHTITGLTDALFAVNEGRISNLYLSLNYKVYAYAQDIPDSEKMIGTDGLEYTSAKVVDTNDDLVFGAVCNEMRRGGSIVRVYVTGSIDITLSGLGKAIIGGFVGKYSGGSINASDMSASLKVRAAAVEAGGLIGVIANTIDSTADDRIEDNNMSISGSIDIGGASIRAGIYVGSLKVRGVELPAFARTNTRLNVNNIDRGNDVYVGYNINID